MGLNTGIYASIIKCQVIGKRYKNYNHHKGNGLCAANAAGTAGQREALSRRDCRHSADLHAAHLSYPVKFSARRLVQVSRSAPGGRQLSCGLHKVFLYGLMVVMEDWRVQCACTPTTSAPRWIGIVPLRFSAIASQWTGAVRRERSPCPPDFAQRPCAGCNSPVGAGRR